MSDSFLENLKRNLLSSLELKLHAFNKNRGLPIRVFHSEPMRLTYINYGEKVFVVTHKRFEDTRMVKIWLYDGIVNEVSDENKGKYILEAKGEAIYEKEFLVVGYDDESDNYFLAEGYDPTLTFSTLAEKIFSDLAVPAIGNVKSGNPT